MNKEKLQISAGCAARSFINAIRNFNDNLIHLRKVEAEMVEVEKFRAAAESRMKEIGEHAYKIFCVGIESDKKKLESARSHARLAAEMLLREYSYIQMYQIPADPELIAAAQSLL